MAENPSDKSCFITCKACFRCADKGRFTKCNSCSGRHDPFDKSSPNPDDYCRCTEGILQWVTQQGQLVVRKYTKNPFAGTVITESKTQDESDWENYLMDLREKMDNPTYNPVQFTEIDVFSSRFKTLSDKDLK